MEKATQQRLLPKKEAKESQGGGQGPSPDSARQQLLRAATRPTEVGQRPWERCLQMSRVIVNLRRWLDCERQTRESRQAMQVQQV